ncbi:MAG: DUF1501 domain-containing protein [Planctomycetota bacterium]
MSAHSLSRRSFLVQGIRLTAIGSLAPTIGAAAPSEYDAGEDDPASDRVLVVVQLSGGNDGLNTVVPHGQDAYYRARPTLAQKSRAVHQLDEHVGLHPSMRGLAELYEEGQLAVVHGVGHPNADRSHFRSMEIWHTAEPFAPAGRVGWLGHMADQLVGRAPGSLPALSVGGGSSLLSMRGAAAVPPMVPSGRGFELAQTSSVIADERARLLQRGRSKPGTDLEFLRAAARTAYDAADRMSAITDTPSEVAYPGQPLARELRLVAQLIRGGFGTRVFHVELGGFDTHASQAPVHAALLEQLSGALTAFQRDLAASGQADRVMTLVFSEFGRRAAENGSRGTDHGRGNPVFVLGSPVRAGQHGERPDLGRLVEGDIPSTTDFRGLYRQLEVDWMDLRPFAKQRIEAPRIV